MLHRRGGGVQAAREGRGRQLERHLEGAARREMIDLEGTSRAGGGRGGASMFLGSLTWSPAPETKFPRSCSDGARECLGAFVTRRRQAFLGTRILEMKRRDLGEHDTRSHGALSFVCPPCLES